MKAIRLMAVVFLMTAVGADGCSSSKPRLEGWGSTFVNPLMQKWAAQYPQVKGVEINYHAVGSGAGIRQTISRAADFGCTDGYLTKQQLEEARAGGGDIVHIPLVMGADVPAYNLAEVKEPLTFSGSVLADIYLGKIKKWNDKALQDLNPAASLPDMDIRVIHRSDGSGTTHVWADYLAKESVEWKEKVGVGNSLPWPCGAGAEGNLGVAERLERTPGAIGYVELTFALEHGLRFGLVQNKAGNAVQADVESITAAADNALAEIPDDLRFSITDPGGNNSYPICGTTWAILYVDQPPDKGRQVVDFLRWVLHEGQDYAADLHYAKLPQRVLERAEKKLDSVKVGKESELSPQQ